MQSQFRIFLFVLNKKRVTNLRIFSNGVHMRMITKPGQLCVIYLPRLNFRLVYTRAKTFRKKRVQLQNVARSEGTIVLQKKEKS